MSNRNSQEAKRAARERLREERERQAKREKVRRQLTVGGAVVAVLAIAGAIGVAVANLDGGEEGDGTDWGAVATQLKDDKGGDSAKAYPAAAPANATGKDGLTIRVGDESAKNTLTLFEDPRCPACAAFEQTLGKQVTKGMEDGTYNLEFVFGTFLDDRLGGSGSRNALSALGAALDVSPEAFLGYHEALYSAEFHPSEVTDEYSSDEHLIEVAQSVPELEGNTTFEKDVKDSTFAVWALEMSKKFDDAPGIEGTPTLELNGKVLETPASAAEFATAIESNLKK